MTQRYSSSSPSLSPCMLRSRPRIPFIRFAKKLESGFLHRIFKRVSSVELSKKFCNVKHTCVGTENKNENFFSSDPQIMLLENQKLDNLNKNGN